MANSKIKLAIKSLNFIFLEEQLPELAILADSAEQYIFSNTNKAVGLLRSFAERIVNIIYSELNLHKPESSNVIDLLNDKSFIESVPKEVISKLSDSDFDSIASSVKNIPENKLKLSTIFKSAVYKKPSLVFDVVKVLAGY